MKAMRQVGIYVAALVLGAGTVQAAERSTTPGDPVKAAKEEGEGLRQELNEASDELGRLEGGEDVHNTFTLDVAGLAVGDGVNGQLVHSVTEKRSNMVGASYSRTSSANGSITKFGAEAGVDWFLVGRRNEGLRVGPRAIAKVGVDTTGGSAGFGEVGAGAEAGYNFITAQGLTAGAAVGWDLVFSGRLGSNNSGDVNGNPYGKLNVGYSW